ncbi:MAG: glycine C-acetyltransferase [Deltaproteobacteria bacterium]|nr:glycine C-acetyltransferase [Deltaproteobacteria bacterium]
MTHAFASDLAARIETLKAEGLFKQEQVIASPQQGEIILETGAACINLCANNYLGLANHPRLIEAAREALREYGFGMSSVRFICGTQLPHKRLEERLSGFLGMEDTILFPSCFDANTGLFESLLDPEDAVISDALNHASIIDGVRLCKAQRFRYANNDMAELEARLREAREARYRLIATDGVFSMDGTIADLPGICDLAERYDAMVMVDDSHAVGFVGAGGRGTPEHRGVAGRVDILTGTLGKALGGAAGGYVSSRREIVEWLRQRARPYLFSNTLAPVIAQTSLSALDLLTGSTELRDRLWRNAGHFRAEMTALGFELLPGEHPIVPLMLRDPKLAQAFADALRERGVLATAFSFPVVPRGQDRIRAQMSAAHTIEDLDRAIAAFAEVGRGLDVIR